MKGGQDPISELRETLRQEPVTWSPDADPGLPAARVRLPDLRVHLDIELRRAGVAVSRMLRTAGRPMALAAGAVDAATDRFIRRADRAATQTVRALRGIATSLSRSARSWVTAAARVRPRRSVRPAPIAPDPVAPAPDVLLMDAGERHLE